MQSPNSFYHIYPKSQITGAPQGWGYETLDESDHAEILARDLQQHEQMVQKADPLGLLGAIGQATDDLQNQKNNIPKPSPPPSPPAGKGKGKGYVEENQCYKNILLIRCCSDTHTNVFLKRDWIEIVWRFFVIN